MSLEEGELILVLSKDTDGWWGGEKEADESRGYFPATYVSYLDGTPCI